ncbi:hypothetical protein Tco_1282106 [Tanacetum coccineum]
MPWWLHTQNNISLLGCPIGPSEYSQHLCTSTPYNREQSALLLVTLVAPLGARPFVVKMHLCIWAKFPHKAPFRRPHIVDLATSPLKGCCWEPAIPKASWSGNPSSGPTVYSPLRFRAVITTRPSCRTLSASWPRITTWTEYSLPSGLDIYGHSDELPDSIQSSDLSLSGKHRPPLHIPYSPPGESILSPYQIDPLRVPYRLTVKMRPTYPLSILINKSKADKHSSADLPKYSLIPYPNISIPLRSPHIYRADKPINLSPYFCRWAIGLRLGITSPRVNRWVGMYRDGGNGGSEVAFDLLRDTLSAIFGLSELKMFPKSRIKVEKYVGGLPDIDPMANVAQALHRLGTGVMKEYAVTLPLCKTSAKNPHFAYECGNLGIQSYCLELKNGNKLEVLKNTGRVLSLVGEKPITELDDMEDNTMLRLHFFKNSRDEFTLGNVKTNSGTNCPKSLPQIRTFPQVPQLELEDTFLTGGRL